MGQDVISFAGLALLYAVLVSGLVTGAAHLVGRPLQRGLPLLLGSTLFFIFLTQHPFPDPAGLHCPVPSAKPQLIPLGFLENVRLLIGRDAGPVEFLANKTVAATVMNFLVCSVIGWALWPHVGRLRTALLLGSGLSLTLELTQLTGLWGIYPCAYRQFNVDDLIMNTLGVCAGMMLHKRRAKTRQ